MRAGSRIRYQRELRAWPLIPQRTRPPATGHQLPARTTVQALHRGICRRQVAGSRRTVNATVNGFTVAVNLSETYRAPSLNAVSTRISINSKLDSALTSSK